MRRLHPAVFGIVWLGAAASARADETVTAEVVQVFDALACTEASEQITLTPNHVPDAPAAWDTFVDPSPWRCEERPRAPNDMNHPPVTGRPMTLSCVGWLPAR